ncbi:MAG: hypothetical protein NTW49_04300 [Bacteroidia bacterium]|nr:hypothetical protein [Bacteroidia bacterium]
MNSIKLYGERNTGSIYLEWLLSNNLNIKLLNDFSLGWKHRLAPEKDELSEDNRDRIIFICIVKNPYSWVYSMHKRPYKHENLTKLSFPDFIRYPYGDYRNPAIMWNLKNKSYLALADFVKNFKMVKYEDLLVEPRTVIESVASDFNFVKSSLWFTDIQQTLTNHHGISKQKFRKEFYLKEEWVKKFTFGDIEFMNTFLDKDLLQKFNYQLVDTEG